MQMFFKYVKYAIFQQYAFRALQSLLMDYKEILSNFCLAPNVIKLNTMKDMVKFRYQIGFHVRPLKNLSSYVYDTSGDGSYVEAAVNCWDISNEHIKIVGKRIKTQADTSPVIRSFTTCFDLILRQYCDVLFSCSAVPSSLLLPGSESVLCVVSRTCKKAGVWYICSADGCLCCRAQTDYILIDRIRARLQDTHEISPIPFIY